jgi:hypothetical protein
MKFSALLLHVLLPLCTILGLVFAVLYRAVPSAFERLSRLFSRSFWFVGATVMIAVYALALVFNLYLPMVIDTAESTVASAAYLWAHGSPLYLAANQAEHYSIMYGPLCYIPFAGALLVFGASIFSLKLLVLLFNLLLFLTIWLVFRPILGKTGALSAMAFVACAFLMKGMSTLMIRGDAPLALCAALALLAVSLRRSYLAVALFALSAAFAGNVKFTAVFYFLVPFYFLWRRYGWGAAIVTAIITPPLILAPFALPHVPLRAYLDTLHGASRQPLGLNVVAMNVVAALILLVPPVLAFSRFYLADKPRALASLRSHWILAVLFLMSIGGSVLTGGKLGSGRPHLNPTFIIAAYLAALIWRETGAVRSELVNVFACAFAVYAIVMVLPAVDQLHDMWGLCVERRAYALEVVSDITGVLLEHPGQLVEMGYDETPKAGAMVSDLTQFRPNLVFAGNPDSTDAVAISDMELSGIAIPQATIDLVRSCRTQIWLIPRDGSPFSTLNLYAEAAPQRFSDLHMFSPAFRSAFFDTYRKVGSSRFYDIWACSTHG